MMTSWLPSSLSFTEKTIQSSCESARVYSEWFADYAEESMFLLSLGRIQRITSLQNQIQDHSFVLLGHLSTTPPPPRLSEMTISDCIALYCLLLTHWLLGRLEVWNSKGPEKT